MPNPSFWVSAALATIPLAGVIGGFTAQLFIATRNFYISNITAERSKWIERLRANLASYSSALSKVAFIKHNTIRERDIKEFEIALFELDIVASAIQLQLNPRGRIDKNILSIVANVPALILSDMDSLGPADKLLIAHVQWLLKAEWDRVKFEARGSLYRRRHRNDYAAFMKSYEAFAADEGSTAAILATAAHIREASHS